MIRMKFNRDSPMLIIPLALLLIATFHFGYGRIHRQHMVSEFNAKLETINNHYQDSLQKQWQSLATALVVMEQNHGFVEALAGQDRARLLEMAADLFAQLRNDFNITHLYFTRPDRVNLLRVHQPQRNGDTIDRRTTLLAESTGEIAHGLELGPLGTFTLRVVAPWRQDGRLIGYVEMGTEIEHLMAGLKPLFGVDIQFMLEKQRLDQSRWMEGMHMLGRIADWRKFDQHVVSFTTNAAMDAELVRYHLAAKADSEDVSDYLFRSGSILIKDLANVRVGELLVVQAIASEQGYEYQVSLWTSLLLALLGGGIVVLLALLFRYVERRIKSTRMKLEQARKEWAAAWDSLPDPVFLHDDELNILHANHAYYQCAGLESENLLGRPYWEVFPKMDGPFDSCQNIMSDNSEAVSEEELHLADGRVFSSRSYPTYDDASEYRYSIHILRDITEKKDIQEKLRLVEIVFDNTVEGVIVTDSDCTILTVNRGFTEITGYQKEQVIGKNTNLLKSGRHDNSFYDAMWSALNSSGHWQGEIWNRRSDGSVYPEWLTITNVLDTDNQTSHYIGIFTDLSEIKATQEQLNRLANYDALTALPNRKSLTKHLDRLLYLALESDTRLAVLVVDLNQFAIINETLGHNVGDILLIDVADRLTSMLRPEDLTIHLDQTAVSDNDVVVSRFAGDEFALVLGRISNVVAAAEVAKRILEVLSERFLIDGNDIFLTASIGISVYPDDVDDAEGLLKCAQTAVNLSKQGGRNNYQYYSEEISAAAVERHNLESALRNALPRNELFLHYQPQLSMDTGRIVGFEALVRWQHPEAGIISPVKFIPLAEESGLILPIGEWVLRTACRQIKQWHDAGLTSGVMAVNISGVQMQQCDLVSVVRNIIEETGIRPEMLELELTESAVMKSPQKASSELGQIKSLGVSLAIDDFGTGYSSLSHLLKFPFDKLKIDRSFITDITTDPDDAVLVRSIIAMARGMRLRVLAEGIETEEQLYYLKRNGCDEMQGYYFSPPIDMRGAEQLLQEKRGLEFNAEGLGDLQLTLLLVDDEENITRSLKRLLRNEGYNILSANRAKEALQIMAKQEVHVILCDQKMPEMTGTELLKQIRDLYPDTIRMILSGYTDMNTVTEAVNSGWIYKFLSKPFDKNELKEQIQDAFNTYKRNSVETIRRL